MALGTDEPVLVEIDGDIEARLRRLEDLGAVRSVLYRYCAAIDRMDLVGVRATMADDIRAKYGNNPEGAGADVITSWIESMTEDCIWQHHFIDVYDVEVKGDRAAALSYHTSHQQFGADPDVTQVIIARYHDQLRREDGSWKITEKVMEILWAGERTDPNGRLDALGGAGPDLPYHTTVESNGGYL